jgi:hypothetical protein
VNAINLALTVTDSTFENNLAIFNETNKRLSNEKNTETSTKLDRI